MDSSRTILAFVMVIVLMTSVLVMFGMMQLFKDPDDQYRIDHDYTISGTYDSMPATGTGHSQYTNENSSFVYRVTTTYTYTDGGNPVTAEAPAFAVICGSDKKVTESLYTNMGTTTSGGVQCGLWQYTDGSLTVTFAIDDKLCIREYTLTDGVLSLTASLM
jgi:hypothetical protein